MTTYPAGLAMSTQNAGDVLLQSLRKAGPLSTGKAVVGRVLSATARFLTQSNSQLVASQPSQASTQKAVFHRNRRLTPTPFSYALLQEASCGGGARDPEEGACKRRPGRCGREDITGCLDAHADA